MHDTPKKAKNPFASSSDDGIRPPILPYHNSASAPYDNSSQDSNTFPTIKSQSTFLGEPSSHRQPVASLQGPQGFFDDDEVQLAERERANAASRASQRAKEKSSALWENILVALRMREKTNYEGERTIYINDAPRNAESRFRDNYVSTGKYNVITFIPKFLAGIYAGNCASCRFMEPG